MDLSTRSVVLRHVERYITEPAYATLALFATRPLYEWCWANFPYSEQWFFVASTMVLHFVLYFGMNLPFYYLDSRQLLQQYKAPRNAAQIPKWDLVKKTVQQAMIGQFITGPPTLYLAYIVFKKAGMPSVDTPLPSPLSCFLCLSVCLFINEHLFYWAHRSFHEFKFLYKWHKQHHEYNGSIGFAAEYAHWTEQILANQGPTVIGAMACGMPLHVWLIWLGTRLFETYLYHSGYTLQGTFLTKIKVVHPDRVLFHDFHHSSNQGNYGSELLDHFFGTNKGWETYLRGVEAAWEKASVPSKKSD